MSLFNKVQNIIFEKNDLQEIKKKYYKSNNNNRPPYDKMKDGDKWNRYKQFRTYLKNKSFGQKLSKFSKSGVGKALIGSTPKGRFVRGALALAGAVKGYDMLKNKLRGDTMQEKDFKLSGPIVDKDGKEIRYSYGGNENTNSKFSNFKLPSNYKDRSKTISDKLKSGQFKVKPK